jgi:predicted nucleotidyltransferase
MELSRVGADLFGAAEAAALRVLAVQGRPVSGREVARLADTNQSSVLRALNRWVQIGVVDAAYAPHATLYTVNRHHVLWMPLEEILAAPARLEQAIAELVRDRTQGRATVAIFGSVARRDSDASSDIDIALVVADGEDPLQIDSLVDELRERVEQLSGNKAQIVEVSEQQLGNMVAHRDPLAVAWADEALTLAGTNLSTLIAEAR